jgi:hypothetical protein
MSAKRASSIPQVRPPPDHAVRPVAARRSKSPPKRSASVTDADIARRAHDLYLARGCEHQHDVDDWLQAERELQTTRPPSAA